KGTHMLLQALQNTGDVVQKADGQELIRIQSTQPFPAIPLNLTTGDYNAPVFSLGGQDDYAFSPDGKEICYASNHDPEPAISTNNDLFTVPVNVNSGSGGTGVSPVQATPAQILAATKDITADNKAADN